MSGEVVTQLIFATNTHVHEEFRKRHADLIDRAINAITLAHDYLDVFRKRAPNEQRSASGNMLRQYTEAVAMALLCLDTTSGVFEQFVKEPMRYPVHKAPDRLLQRKRAAALKDLIQFDAKARAKVLDLTELYGSLSHASALSLAHTQMLNSDNRTILGGEYDPFKADAYEKDLRRCASAAEALAHLMSVVMAKVYPEP